MSRWIVFDESTAHAVQTSTGVQPEIRPGAVKPGKFFDLALESRASVAIMPGEHEGGAILMRVSRREQSRETAAGSPASNMAPAGFLGLSDGVDMDSEPERPKKWWQKILD
ncbi:MAG: hypothetical protein ACXVZJ_03690 [Terriglobales bacterium]